MSFAFLPLYTGDYLRDTRHLSPLRHGVYFLLLMHCWDSRGPVPLDEQEAAGIANCRSSDEIDALRYVLERFFIRMDDGWYNHRMQTEVERASAISKARGFAGKLGGLAKAKHLPSKSQAIVSTPQPQPPLQPQPESQRTKTKGAAQAPFVLPPWIPEQHWNAWLEARAKIRKPATDYAKRLAVLKLENLKEQGHEPVQVLMQSAFNGWQGLFPPKEIK